MNKYAIIGPDLKVSNVIVGDATVLSAMALLGTVVALSDEEVCEPGMLYSETESPRFSRAQVFA